MRHRWFAVALLAPLIACAAAEDGGQPAPQAPGEVEAPLVLTATIPLPDVSGRIDHMALDTKRNRLAVAALGNGSLELVALDEGKRVRRVPHLSEPQGVEYVPDADRFAVACGGDGTVRLYDAGTLELAAQLDPGGDADNVHRAATGTVFWVAYGHGGLIAVDAATGEAQGTVKLDDHPEGFALEARGPRAFVNLAGRGEVAVVDRGDLRVTARWGLDGARANFPCALDEAAHRLYVGCRRPSRIVVLDTTDGAVRATLECSGDPDDLFVDAARHRLYAACGSGTIDVVDIAAAEPRVTAHVATASGARTALLRADGSALYLAVPKRGDRDAEIRVYAPR